MSSERKIKDDFEPDFSTGALDYERECRTVWVTDAGSRIYFMTKYVSTPFGACPVTKVISTK